MRTTPMNTPITDGSSAIAPDPRGRRSDETSSSRAGPAEVEVDALSEDWGPEGMALRNKLTVTVPEAAALLGISRAFGYELVARGELPAIRLGNRIVVPTQRLLSLVFDEQ